MLTFEKYHEVIIIPSNIEELNIVEAFLDKLSLDLDLNEMLYGNIMISVTEAVNNAISHGNCNDIQKKVIITAILNNPYSLSIFVEDQGAGFDIHKVKDPTASENILSENGRGVFVMKHLADDLVYHGNGNIVELKFNI